MHIKFNKMKIHFFNIFEFILFILPALPNSIKIRLFILFIYFIAHFFNLQNVYLKNKKCILEK